MSPFDAIVIGAGPAGLASAASLRRRGLSVAVLEKAGEVASVWRRHYDRLRLHTARSHSSLPGLAMDRAYGRFPTRAQLVEYVERYAARFELSPKFYCRVDRIAPEAGAWRVETEGGALSARVIVIAIGWADFPFSPKWPDSDLYKGETLHSSGYRNPARFAGKRVLVVGLGNSGAEIALDLADAAVKVAVSVRGPVRIVPRELLGLPIVSWAIAQRALPARVADALSAPLLRLAMGSMESLGLRTDPKGPRRMVEEDGRVPMLDIGAVAKIRSGAIGVRGPVERMTADGVKFVETGAERFDAVIFATGYRPDFASLLPSGERVLDGRGRPLASGRATAAPGLFFCGALPSPTGQLREIGLEAERIGELARRYVSAAPRA